MYIVVLKKISLSSLTLYLFPQNSQKFKTTLCLVPGAKAKIDWQNSVLSFKRSYILHRNLEHQPPYRKSMDPGCGSATVLIPLQVLLSSCYGRKALIRSNTVYFWILDNLNSLLVTNTMRLEITWKLLTRFHFWIRVDIPDTCSKRMRIQVFWILVQKKNTYLSVKSFHSAPAEVSYAQINF